MKPPIEFRPKILKIRPPVDQTELEDLRAKEADRKRRNREAQARFRAKHKPA